MSEFDSIAAAFDNGPVDARKPNEAGYQREELERLFEQALCLAKCASLVYPTPRKGRCDKRLKECREKLKKLDADAIRDESITIADLRKLVFSHEEWEMQRNREPIGGLENDLDDIAVEFRKQYTKKWCRRHLVPWGLFSDARKDEMNEAQKKWMAVNRLWLNEATIRIEKILGEDYKLRFASHGGIEYFLAGNEELIILCFRGTEPNKPGDILTDLFAWQTSESGRSGVKPRFHDGFWHGLNGVYPKLVKSLRTDLNEQEDKDGFRNRAEVPGAQKLWITGHSLGGALATLAAYRLSRDEKYKTGELPEIGGVFTFGQPRVGDAQFAEEYGNTQRDEPNKTGTQGSVTANGSKPKPNGPKPNGPNDDRPIPSLHQRHFRFVNNNDVVTIVPPKIPFRLPFGLTFSQNDDAGPTQTEHSISYSDVGKVVAVNRPKRAKLLTPLDSPGWKFWTSNFWWPVQYRMGRLKSLQLFRLQKLGFMKRFLPGITDHSMDDYVEALNFECGYQAFTQVAIDYLKSELHGNGAESPRLIAGICKTADWAWKNFGHTRFEDELKKHRDAPKQRQKTLGTQKPKARTLGRTLKKSNASLIERVANTESNIAASDAVMPTILRQQRSPSKKRLAGPSASESLEQFDLVDGHVSPVNRAE